MNRPSSSGPSQRQLRVGEQVRHAVSQVLQRGEVRDPLLETAVISISEVRMSPDLKIATCFVSPLGAVDGEAVIKALNHHAKFIRGRAGSMLRQMKYMPEFRFRIDTSFDNYAKIDALLSSPEVSRDLGGANPDQDVDIDVDGDDGDGNE
ncbi:MAG: 30S ribosome-binding factor RbfA [Phyllobacterium sp.]